MSNVESQLTVTGGVTKALLAAMDTLHEQVAARLIRPDGQPDEAAMYFQLPMGRPIDPKMYRNPWTPSGVIYDGMDDTGAFATPAVEAAPADAQTPAKALERNPQPDDATKVAMNSAFMTSRLVDNMLCITKDGVMQSWPSKTVGFSYEGMLTGMQALPAPEPSDEIKERIAEAEKTLYILDEGGNYVDYTPLHNRYRKNREALAEARAKFAVAYAAASADPAAGEIWPVTSGPLQAAVDQAYNDFRNMGADRVEAANSTLQSIGGSAAAAMIAKARRLFDSYSVNISGQIAEKVPWSYIDPVSWCDHNNTSIGVWRIAARSNTHTASGSGGSTSFSSSFYQNEASSWSGSAGYSFFFGISADASSSESSHDDGWESNHHSWEKHEDASSNASIEFEWFLATIERPWFIGDLFHFDGWYMTGSEQDSISDGTIDGQLGEAPKLLPMVPKAFVVARNVKITADTWGSLGQSMDNAKAGGTGHTESSSTSYGGSLDWFGWGGSVAHSESSSSGAFSSSSSADHSWDFKSTSGGGELTMLGAQIIGWIGQIQPAAPRIDDPNLGAATDATPIPDPDPDPETTTPETAATTNEPVPAAPPGG